MGKRGGKRGGKGGRGGRGGGGGGGGGRHRDGGEDGKTWTQYDPVDMVNEKFEQYYKVCVCRRLV